MSDIGFNRVGNNLKKTSKGIKKNMSTVLDNLLTTKDILNDGIVVSREIAVKYRIISESLKDLSIAFKQTVDSLCK